MNIDNRFKKFEIAKGRRSSWDDTYKDALKYTAQHRETFDYHTRGEQKFDRIFDSTGLISLSKFAANIQSGLVPPFKKWLKLIPGADIPAENIDDAGEQLRNITDSFFKYLHSSNFDVQISEAFLDLGVGTGALLVQEGDDENPLNFLAVPLSELYLSEGPFGRVQDVFRLFKIQQKNIKATWPNANFSDFVGDDVAGEEEIEILEATVFNNKTKKYEYTIDMISAKRTILLEQKDSSPWIIFRWSAMPGEVYGRGVVLNALPDIKTLNKASEILLQSSALKSIPTFMVADDGVINAQNIKIGVGGFIPTAPWGPGGPPIKALEVGGDVNLSQFVIEKIQSRIEDHMFANPLGDINLPVKTATEMSLRSQELSNRIGSAFGRLHFELIGPLVNRILYILEKRGLLPVSLKDIKVDGKVISISYQSPLALAQDEEEVVNAIRYVKTMMEVLGQQLLPLFVDLDKFSELVSDNLGVKGLIPSADKRKEVVGLISQLAQSSLGGGQQQQPPPEAGVVQ